MWNVFRSLAAVRGSPIYVYIKSSAEDADTTVRVIVAMIGVWYQQLTLQAVEKTIGTRIT